MTVTAHLSIVLISHLALEEDKDLDLEVAVHEEVMKMVKNKK